MKFPADGDYLVAVHGWGADTSATFDLTINAVQGESLQVADLPAGPYQPNQPIAFNVKWTLAKPLAVGESAQGLILTGPSAAPGALSIPVRLHNITSSSKTVQLPVMADSSLDRWPSGPALGSSPFLYAGFGDSLRSVLKFDTSSIASTYPVESAVLHVYVDGYGSTGQPHTLAAYGLILGLVENPWSLEQLSIRKSYNLTFLLRTLFSITCLI